MSFYFFLSFVRESIDTLSGLPLLIFMNNKLNPISVGIEGDVQV